MVSTVSSQNVTTLSRVTVCDGLSFRKERGSSGVSILFYWIDTLAVRPSPNTLFSLGKGPLPCPITSIRPGLLASFPLAAVMNVGHLNPSLGDFRRGMSD